MKHFIFRSKNIFIALAFLPLQAVKAQNWTGNVDADWNNPANWTGWPLAGDDLLVDPINYTGAAASPAITANSVFTPGGIILQNGAQLTVGANLSANDRIEIIGTGTQVTINGGTLHAAGSGSDGRFIVSDGAVVNMNGGTLTANQRIIVELGGIFNLVSGTVNPVQELAIGDGNLTNSSLFNMTGGTVNIGLDLGFENEAGLYAPTFQMSGGTVQVNGGISWLGVAPGAGMARFIMTGGTTTVDGDILNDPTSTIDLFMHLSGTAQFNFGGALIDLTRSTDSIVQEGNSIFTLSNTNNWNNAGVFHSTGAITRFNGNTNLNGTGSYAFHQVEINPTKTLSQVSPTSISIGGDLQNNGTFNTGTHTVVFNGSTAQNISGSTVTPFHHFTLNNAMGLTLDQSATIAGHLLLTDGKLNTSTAHLLNLHDNATASAGSDTSFVNGPLKKTGDDAFVFPIGKNNRWRRMEMSAPPATGSSFTAEYHDASYVSLSPVTSPLSAVTGLEYWTMDKLTPTDNVQVGLYWEDASTSAITDCAELSIAHWTGSAWENILSTTTGTCTGTGQGSILSNATTAEAGVFTFGFYNGVTTQAFSICDGDSVVVGTHAYYDAGTYIDVLTSSAMTDSVVITQLSVSAPISLTQSGITLTAFPASATAYQWVDCNNAFAPISGENAQVFTATTNGSYAVIVSQDGCTDTTTCALVTTTGIVSLNHEDQVRVYPNPGHGQLTLEIGGSLPARYRLTDPTGRLIMENELVSRSTVIDYSSQLNGIYLLEVIREGFSSVTRLIKY